MKTVAVSILLLVLTFSHALERGKDRISYTDRERMSVLLLSKIELRRLSFLFDKKEQALIFPLVCIIQILLK